mmetsp:Transcript_39242/g.70223  ORF Transcript_39242/g.70223 Transcript_39242/m.70223 type:complete len:152 (-) Transcript_39242:190-645(-)
MMKLAHGSDGSSLPALLQGNVSFVAKGRLQGDDNIERLLMPKLPQSLQKHLWQKTPNFRRKIANYAQLLLDAAKEEGPEAVQQMRAAIAEGTRALNHEADLHPLHFKQSLKDLEVFEKILKVHSMEHFSVFFHSWPRERAVRDGKTLKGFL